MSATEAPGPLTDEALTQIAYDAAHEENRLEWTILRRPWTNIVRAVRAAVERQYAVPIDALLAGAPTQPTADPAPVIVKGGDAHAARVRPEDRHAIAPPVAAAPDAAGGVDPPADPGDGGWERIRQSQYALEERVLELRTRADLAEARVDEVEGAIQVEAGARRRAEDRIAAARGLVNRWAADDGVHDGLLGNCRCLDCQRRRELLAILDDGGGA